MKKLYLFFLILVPVTVGYIYNVTFVFLGNILFYLLPIIMLIFWFWVGGNFKKAKVNILQAVLVGNSLGIISLIIWIWQFLFKSDAERNLLFAGFSQMFSSSISPLTAQVSTLFGTNMYVAIQIIGLIIMIVDFTLGYYLSKKRDS